MDDDLAKKQRPSDDDNENGINNSQDENDKSGLEGYDLEHKEEEDANKRGKDNDKGGSINNLQDYNDDFGLEEYGYDLEFGEEEDTDKQKKKEEEESEGEKDAKSREEDKEYRKRIKELEELRKMREEKRKKDFGKMKEKDEKKEKEKEKKEKQWEETDEKQEEQKQKLIAGEKVERKRVFTHKKSEGVFRHKKLSNFSTRGVKKIDKRFKKVHGISSEKKRKFIRLLEAYNPSKSVMTRKTFDDFVRRFNSKRFSGPNFDRMEKEGIDLRSARKEFNRRKDINKLRRGITGGKDPHKYRGKSSSQKNSSSRNLSSGIATRMR